MAWGAKGKLVSTPAPLNAATLRAMTDFPDQLERFYEAIPESHSNWTPASWDGIPSETFSALGQVCHAREQQPADAGRNRLQCRLHRATARPE